MEMIRKTSLVFLMLLATIACKDDVTPVEVDPEVIAVNKLKDSLFTAYNNAKAAEQTRDQIKAALRAKGFKTYDYIDEKTNDTILMQQYFIGFIKLGAIRGQNEEESFELQEQHLDYLANMYKMGNADISGLIMDDSEYVGITVYNVPTKRMAQRLVDADPMVKENRIEIDVFPWWAVKGRVLR